MSQIQSNLRSDTKQITFGLNGINRKGILFNASYTLTSSFDQSQGFSGAPCRGSVGRRGRRPATRTSPRVGGAVTTLGVTRFLRRSRIRSSRAFELTAIARATSGSFFAPLVGGDINGDGRFNDRAFIFDPAVAAAAGDTAVANGMTRLLANTSSRARDCLLTQMGTIAARSSCSSPWSPALDLQANIRPSSFGLDRRLTISVITQNTLTGLDQLLHGSNNLHGWGQPSFPDRTLLYVRGFDPTTGTYQYQVNEHFGATNGTRNAFRVPVSDCDTGAPYTRTDPARQQFNNAMVEGAPDASLRRH